jgi:hypothetical protein
VAVVADLSADVGEQLVVVELRDARLTWCDRHDGIGRELDRDGLAGRGAGRLD